jgi:hypothetical protein
VTRRAPIHKEFERRRIGPLVALLHKTRQPKPGNPSRRTALSALFPGILGKKRIQMGNGVELAVSNAIYADLEAMIKDIRELSVQVDDDEGKQVRIRCE